MAGEALPSTSSVKKRIALLYASVAGGFMADSRDVSKSFCAMHTEWGVNFPVCGD